MVISVVTNFSHFHSPSLLCWPTRKQFAAWRGITGVDAAVLALETAAIDGSAAAHANCRDVVGRADRRRVSPAGIDIADSATQDLALAGNMVPDRGSYL
jgi:hypothetical protein